MAANQEQIITTPTEMQTLYDARFRVSQTFLGKQAVKDNMDVVGSAIADYCNALHTARPDHVFGSQMLTHVTRGIHIELESIANMSHANHQLPCSQDTKNLLVGYLEDEGAAGLREQRIDTMDRAITLTLLDQLHDIT